MLVFVWWCLCGGVFVVSQSSAEVMVVFKDCHHRLPEVLLNVCVGHQNRGVVTIVVMVVVFFLVGLISRMLQKDYFFGGKEFIIEMKCGKER